MLTDDEDLVTSHDSLSVHLFYNDKWCAMYIIV